MGKTTGFLEFQRKNNKDIPVEERIQNFEEFHIPLAREERKQQAARCMNCGVPFCQSRVERSDLCRPYAARFFQADQDQQFSGIHRKSLSGIV